LAAYIQWGLSKTISIGEFEFCIAGMLLSHGYGCVYGCSNKKGYEKTTVDGEFYPAVACLFAAQAVTLLGPAPVGMVNMLAVFIIPLTIP